MKKLSPLALIAITSLPVILAVILCIQFVDEDVASAIWRFTSSHPGLHKHIREINSPLSAMVAILTITMWLVYYLISRAIGWNRQTQFIKLAATALPVAFLAKILLQNTFGRTGPRMLLEGRYHSEFQWFKIEGCFPSGHTIVLTALLTAIWFHSPRFRTVTIALFTGLASALLLSSYHFFSDIIAGGYGGILITTVLNHFLSEPRTPSQ